MISRLWLVRVDCPGYPTNPSPFDFATAFPRYYFDLGRAKLEMEALFEKRRYTPAPLQNTTTGAQD